MLTHVSIPAGPEGQLPQKAQVHGGILRLPAIEPSDQGQYLCRARSSAGQHVARAVLQVQGGSGPRVQVSPERTQVHEGRTVRLYCRAAGVPSASITWRKEGGSLPPQVSQPGCPNRVPVLNLLSLHALSPLSHSRTSYLGPVL